MSNEKLNWGVYKHLSKTQLIQLESTTDVAICRDLLAEFMGLKPSERDDKTEVLVDFYLYNYAFCKEQRFNAEKTSAYMSIMRDIINEDITRNDAVSQREESFLRFKEEILRHSVERPPWSIGLFSIEDTAGIIEYTVNSYFRHYHLYKHLFTVRVEMSFKQQGLHGVEEPRVPVPSARGILIERPNEKVDSSH